MFLGLFLSIYSATLWAMPAEEKEETRVPILDSAEEFFGHRVNHLANDFDSFFATERADDELGRTRLRLRGNYTVTERSLPNDDVQIRFNLRLPHLEQKFKMNVEDKKKLKDPKSETPEQRAKREAELKKRNRIDERWLINGDTGVNASIHPSITVRGRIRKNLETGTVIHRFVQEATWVSTRDGFRNRTALTNDHSIDQMNLIRFNNSADWQISKKTFTTAHGPSFLHRISDFEALSYGFSMSTVVTGGSWYVTGFQLAPTYRRNVYREILYLDLTPGLNFPKEWSFRRTPFIFVQLELLFGGT